MPPQGSCRPPSHAARPTARSSGGSSALGFTVSRLRRCGRHGVATRAAAAARPDVTAGGFEGKVTDAKTKAGLTGVEVCAYELKALAEGAYEEELEPSCATVTAASGKYKLAVPAGEYVVAFLDPAGDYVTQLYNGRSVAEEPNPVKVKAEAFTPKIDAALVEGGRIKGTVTAAEGGAPLAHVLVCAFLANGEEIEECTFTASDGTYSVERLPTGIYEVEFFDLPKYLTQFYAGAPHLAGAKSISVTAGGAPATGIDAQMLLAGTIEGQVTSAATSAPLGSVQVCAIALPEQRRQMHAQPSERGLQARRPARRQLRDRIRRSARLCPAVLRRQGETGRSDTRGGGGGRNGQSDRCRDGADQHPQRRRLDRRAGSHPRRRARRWAASKSARSCRPKNPSNAR